MICLIGVLAYLICVLFVVMIMPKTYSFYDTIYITESGLYIYSFIFIFIHFYSSILAIGTGPVDIETFSWHSDIATANLCCERQGDVHAKCIHVVLKHRIKDSFIDYRLYSLLTQILSREAHVDPIYSIYTVFAHMWAFTLASTISKQ